MKSKLLLISLLVFGSLTATAASWHKYDVSGVSESFVDLASIRTDGEVTSYRVLTNFTQFSAPIASVIFELEMRCSKRDSRFIKTTSYAQPFGAGHVVAIATPKSIGFDPTKFFPIDHGAVSQYPIVCRSR